MKLVLVCGLQCLIPRFSLIRLTNNLISIGTLLYETSSDRRVFIQATALSINLVFCGDDDLCGAPGRSRAVVVVIDVQYGAADHVSRSPDLNLEG